MVLSLSEIRCYGRFVIFDIVTSVYWYSDLYKITCVKGRTCVMIVHCK
jgi:hypothetical protein